MTTSTYPPVGAPEDTNAPEKKPALSPPPLLKQAEEEISKNIGAPTNQADRDRVFAYRAEPFMKQIKDTTNDLSKYFESQGLRFSTERRDMIGDKVTEIGRQMGESVMVPQIEREQAERQGWAKLGIDLGSQQATLDLQTRRMNLDETNAAMDRAVAQGKATGTFTDPVSGISYDTLEKKVQQFSESIQNRQTLLMETNAAFERAERRGQQTGIYIDPITGESSETLTKRKDDFQRIVDRATATGWWEETATLNRETLLGAAGADTDNGLGEQPAGTTPPADTPPAGTPGEDDPETVKQKLKKLQAETAWRDTRLPQYRQETGASDGQLMTLVTELGIEGADSLLNRLISGEPITLGEIKALVAKGGSSPAFEALKDMLSGEGTDDSSRVWLKGKPPAGMGGSGAPDNPIAPGSPSGPAPLTGTAKDVMDRVTAHPRATAEDKAKMEEILRSGRPGAVREALTFLQAIDERTDAPPPSNPPVGAPAPARGPSGLVTSNGVSPTPSAPAGTPGAPRRPATRTATRR